MMDTTHHTQQVTSAVNNITVRTSLLGCNAISIVLGIILFSGLIALARCMILKIDRNEEDKDKVRGEIW